jgi:hypothetical protein
MQTGMSLDPQLFWVPAVYFYFNSGLSPERQGMFLSIMGSIPESPFSDLVLLLQGDNSQA